MVQGRRKSPRNIRITDWDLDEANIAELDAHGITIEILDQVSEEAPRFRPNKRHRAATQQMIGPDRGGRMWIVCILETQLSVWRPITG